MRGTTIASEATAYTVRMPCCVNLKATGSETGAPLGNLNETDAS